MTRIFHLALPDDWAAAQAAGTYTTSTRGVTLEQEGFIHCSLREQVDAVREAFYADVEVLLLAIDTERLTSPWRMDPVEDTEFPHVYGPIDVDAVVDVSLMGIG